MPRRRSPDRLDALAAAAIAVFSRVGFSKALMSDVAAEMGVSAGLLYTYVESKEALFLFALTRSVEDAPSDGEVALPMSTPAPGAMAQAVASLLRARMAHPGLRAALRQARADDVRGELEGIIREHYRAVHRCRALLTMVDRSAGDLVELGEQSYGRSRGRFVDRLGDYLRSRIGAGQLRAVRDPDVTARLIVETVAWFANHRFGDLDGASIDDTVAEDTVVDVLLAGLIEGDQA